MRPTEPSASATRRTRASSGAGGRADRLRGWRSSAGPRRPRAPRSAPPENPVAARIGRVARVGTGGDPARTPASSGGSVAICCRAGPCVMPTMSRRSRPAAAWRATSETKATVSPASARRAPGPIPSWARTTAPDRSRGSHRVEHLLRRCPRASRGCRRSSRPSAGRARRPRRAVHGATSPHGVRHSARGHPDRPQPLQRPLRVGASPGGVARRMTDVLVAVQTDLVTFGEHARHEIGMRRRPATRSERTSRGRRRAPARRAGAAVQSASGPSSNVSAIVPHRGADYPAVSRAYTSEAGGVVPMGGPAPPGRAVESPHFLDSGRSGTAGAAHVAWQRRFLYPFSADSHTQNCKNREDRPQPVVSRLRREG